VCAQGDGGCARVAILAGLLRRCQGDTSPARLKIGDPFNFTQPICCILIVFFHTFLPLILVPESNNEVQILKPGWRWSRGGSGALREHDQQKRDSGRQHIEEFAARSRSCAVATALSLCHWIYSASLNPLSTSAF
jgi:hypothetical protein